MSESSEHRGLVVAMADYLVRQYPGIIVDKDVQIKPGDPLPQKIGEHRPDIYAYYMGNDFRVVGEAKTSNDLENSHSNKQISTFVTHLESNHRGIFLLGISGEKADRAKTLLRFLSKDMELKTTRLQIFDGFDYWMLDNEGGVRWLLN